MKLKRTAVLLITVLLILGLYSSCGEKRPSLGNINKIIVVADSTLWLQVQDKVRDALARKILTPQPEAVFSLLQRNPDQLGRLSRVPNILLLGTLDAEGKVQEYVDNLLSESSREQVIQKDRKSVV